MHVIIYLRLKEKLPKNFQLPCTIFFSSLDPNVIALTKIFKQNHEFNSWLEEMKSAISRITFTDSLFKLNIIENVDDMNNEIDKFIKLSLLFNQGSICIKNYSNSVLNNHFNFVQQNNDLFINKELHDKPFK